MTNSISIVTPWINCPELIPAYEIAVHGAEQVIIIDNGSEPEASKAIAGMVNKLGGVLIRNENNLGYARANNQGLAVATGDIVIFLNNDIVSGGIWLDAIREGVKAGNIIGPSMSERKVDDMRLPYIEGWCIAARRETWNALHGWDADAFPGCYWEDNDICFRAFAAGYQLIKVDLPLRHLSNYTSKRVPGAYDSSFRNQAMFYERVRKWKDEVLQR